MALSPQDALIYLMIIAASSDSAISEGELGNIRAHLDQLPVFDGFETARFPVLADECIDLVKDTHNLDKALDMVVAAIPKRLQDTAYALAVEVTVVDLRLEQEELRLLEMIRDRLDLDRLVTAAIEASARARMRRA